jgi:hypothetical protein
VKLPNAKDIVAACEAAGLPRTIDTVRGWTCGRRCPPVWVPVVIAENTECWPGDEDNARSEYAGELAEEFTKRWRAKQGLPDEP